MIPVFRPYIGEKEVEYVSEVLKSRWIGLGPKTKELEEKFAELAGVNEAVGLNSGTAALDLALKCLGIDSGEVIVPSFTFVASVHAVLYNNSTPVFTDIDANTLTIDPEDVKKKITDKTRAIIVVHYGGHPCDMDAIMDIAKENNLKVIEDCAHAAVSEYKGRKVGGIGDAGCFSFHAVKNIATGDGGILTLNDAEAADKARKMRWFGISKDTAQRSGKSYEWDYSIDFVGYKYHMNDIMAAVTLAQLEKLDEMNDKRREIAAKYNSAFKKVPEIEVIEPKGDVKSAYWNYVIKAENRDDLIVHLKEKGISTSVHYMPIHLQPCYSEFKEGADVPVTEDVWKKVVTLPLFYELTDEEITKIINEVKNFYN